MCQGCEEYAEYDRVVTEYMVRELRNIIDSPRNIIDRRLDAAILNGTI